MVIPALYKIDENVKGSETIDAHVNVVPGEAVHSAAVDVIRARGAIGIS